MRGSIAIIFAGLVAPLICHAAPTEDHSIRRAQPQQGDSNEDHPGCPTKELGLPAYVDKNKIPEPKPGSLLLLISHGIGTQNYTCSSDSDTEKPKAIGAVARLTNATCEVARGELDDLPEGPPFIGLHYFLDLPHFDVPELGNAVVNKTHSQEAIDRENNVPYLRLETIPNHTINTAVREIYRLGTQGGVAPKDCSGQTPGKVITVPYKAQYWFYGGRTVGGRSE